MSTCFRAGKVPAMQKGGHILRQRQGAGKSSFWGGAWGSDPERAGGGLEDWGNRCSGSSHDFAQAAAGVGGWIQPKYSAWAKDHVLMGFGSRRLWFLFSCFLILKVGLMTPIPQGTWVEYIYAYVKVDSTRALCHFITLLWGVIF